LLSDETYWTGEAVASYAHIGEGSAVMHEREYFVGTLGTDQIRNFRRRMGRAHFRGEAVDVEAWLWNSGAVGLNPAHAPIIADWIDYLDEIHPRNRKPIVEQYAISWLLQRRVGTVAGCGDLLVHYWADKDRHLAAIRGALERLRALPPDEGGAWLRSDPLRVRGPPPARKRDSFLQRMRTSVSERLPLMRRDG